jgi:acyl-CoA thioesterase YciA
MPDHQDYNPNRKPRGELSTRTLAMPADANQNGDIFGGWLLGQMDIGGGFSASTIAKGPTVTVAIDAMSFKKPVYIGDVVAVYTDLIRIGNTSIRLHVEAWVTRRNAANNILVTEGNFTYVAIDENHVPRSVKKPE